VAAPAVGVAAKKETKTIARSIITANLLPEWRKRRIRVRILSGGVNIIPILCKKLLPMQPNVNYFLLKAVVSFLRCYLTFVVYVQAYHNRRWNK
jgi:hypothetical protein